MIKPTPAGYRPSGSQCAQCQRAAEDCSRLDFAAMRTAGKRDADGVQRVACSGYVRAGIPTLDEIKAAQGPLIDAIKSAHPNVTGNAYAGAALLNLLGADSRPCRCGPEGCADSECIGRTA